MSIVQNGNPVSTESNFRKEFGQLTDRQQNTARAPGGNNDKPQQKAQYWLNIGVMTKVQNAEGEMVDHFTALPQGIPLDTMKPVEVKGTADFRARLTAQNDLLKRIQERAATIEPGETALFTFDQKGLAVQIRRAKAEEAPIAAEENQYSVNLDF